MSHTPAHHPLRKTVPESLALAAADDPSTSGQVQAESGDLERERGGVWASPYLLTILVALGFLPLLYWHVLQLAQKSHYHFLAVLPIAAVALARGIAAPKQRKTTRGSGQEAEPISVLATDFSSPLVPLGCLVAALLGLVVAMYVWSPWLAAVAAYFAVLPCLWFFRGWYSVRRWAPLWVLFAVVIPPPFGMDEDLILWLRGHATNMTSAVLDQFNVLHRSYANVIELPERKLFIADACSGIHSLYVLLGAALFLGLLNGRNWIHIGVLLLTTFGIVLVENVARLTSVALGFQYRMDLSEGPNHAYLGFILFGLSLGLVLSADQFWRFILGANPKLPFLPRSTKASSSASENDESNHRIPRAWRIVLLNIGLCFPLLAVAQVFAMPGAPPTVAHLFDDSLSLPDFGPDAAPEQFGGFRRFDYERIRRVPGDPFGQESQQWVYSHPDGTQAMISIDFPYEGVHDACECYTQVGWDIYEQSIQTAEQLSGIGGLSIVPDGPMGLARMRQTLDGEGLLLSSCSDMEGNVAVVLKELLQRNAGERLAARFGGGTDRDTIASAGQGTAPPFVQFQLLAKSANGFSEQQLAELTNLYLTVRAHLKSEVLRSVLEAKQ
ncbi:exosortase U [Stieleria varia]|uniref:exosortase U n=1 Tax=Stieleria varia TaxID=2528005 RepID=UPI0018D2307F|nr:exosortase U [Stieleria varia]